MYNPSACTRKGFFSPDTIICLILPIFWAFRNDPVIVAVAESVGKDNQWGRLNKK